MTDIDLSGFDVNSVSSIESNEVEDTTSSEDIEDLEIYRKARNFDKLHLVSGSTVNEDVATYVKNTYGTEGTRRLGLAKFLLEKLGFIPSDDVLLMLSCTKKARIVVATAGAGKTTSLQLDLLVSKMLDTVLHCYDLDPMPVGDTDVTLPRILYLNYNKHNVRPIEDRYHSLCARVNKYIVEKIDDGIESSTVHAFCHKSLLSFGAEVSIPEFKLISSEDKTKLWTSIATPRWSKFYGDSDLGVDIEVLDSLYQYKTESMVEWDEFFQSSKFLDTELKSEFVKSCLKKYDGMKSSLGLMDFTDYLLLTIDVLRKNPELQERIQKRYRIIVADENQDFTRLMNELLLLLYNPEYNHIVIVGDPDQTIYQFKGVSPDNIVDIYEKLSDVELLGLDTNYRCPDRIVDAAKKILDLNILRFKKPIKTVRTGGAIIKHPLLSANEQYREVSSVLNRIGKDGYGSTVITYRNNRSSIIIGEELYYANIPFTMLDDKRPFNNMVFRHIREALQALRTLDDMALNKNLYRFLPLSREMWSYIIDENYKYRHTFLQDIILPDGVPSGTARAFEQLLAISQRIASFPCSDYIGTLFQLYRTYYFDFISKNPVPVLGDTDIYLLWLERTMKFWTRPYTFAYMEQELIERNVDRPNAVTLSTFHGLKGLEFDYVLAVDFNDAIFPNYFGIEQRYPKNTALEEKESENRLCYVLTTRTIKELHLFYLESDPSMYVDVLANKHLANDTTEVLSSNDISLGTIAFPTDGVSAKLRFIQRLTEDRRK